MDEVPETPRGWRRLVHVLVPLALAMVIVVPTLPSRRFGKFPGTVAGWMRPLSFAQVWRMYAPDAQRSQMYMDLTAYYPGGREEKLEETLIEENGWGTTWAGRKTRVDIWRYYANINPNKSSAHRKWYLRAVCIREARKGEIPTKIVMEVVRRRFTPPGKVARGKPDLGRAKRKVIEWMPCKNKVTLEMIEADRARRGEGA